MNVWAVGGFEMKARGMEKGAGKAAARPTMGVMVAWNVAME